MTPRPFRFGVISGTARSGEEWAGKARAVESLGYATFLMPDTVRYTLAPVPAAAIASAATHTLRVGTYVFANDYRNPVLLAKDAATLDLLSGGRFELGIGAGRPSAAEDNRMLGLAFDSGGLRVDRLAESLTLIKALLSGQTVSAPGPHYAVTNAEVMPRPLQQPRPPILIAASGRRLLTLAAREADIVALGVLPTEPEAAVAEKIGWLREAAGSRFEQIEINISLMAVGQQVPQFVSREMGLSAEAVVQSGGVPVLLGSTDEMCATLLRRRDTLGISYIVVSEELMETLAPVVERLAGH